MRIILDLQACQASSMHRGIGRYSMALALAMARNSAGNDVRIVLNEDYPDSVATIRQAFDTLLPQSQISTFVTPVPVGEVDARNAWRVHAAERIRTQYLASLRPDMVHVASLFEGLGDNVVASVPPDEGRFGTAVTLYDLIPLMRKERYLGDPNLAAWYYRKLESMKRAGLLLAISQSARQEGIDLLQLPPERVINISSAVDDVFRPRVLPPGARADLLARHGIKRDFIMYTGGIDYRKNIEGLIEAYAMLAPEVRRRYQLAVVCVIRDPDRFRLERLAAKAGLAKDDLVLTGFVSDDDLISMYNCTALFVFPSLHEGFGLPALEAMACGAPVIGSNTSSIPEVIGRADAMFDPNDVNAICASMAAVLCNPARSAELRAHGLSQATRFSWDASAQRAIAAFEEHHARTTARVTSQVAGIEMPQRKPRMAFVSPFPPLRSGIADFSADLLPELARYYDIELVLAQDDVDSSVVPEQFMRRTAAWFSEHAHEFDRILYQFGNSAFHSHMFGLLERHPGVVVLHDFFLSGIINHDEINHHLPNNYCRTLYGAHGYPALMHEKADGRIASFLAYPCNKNVLDRATGVLVHSEHARTLAEQWYGPGFAASWGVLPLLRTLPDCIDREGARRKLGLAADDFVLCSFGFLSSTKCNDRIVDAWLNSALSRDQHCHLVLVGELAVSRFGVALRERVAAHPRIRITGYVSQDAYRAWLAAADGAIQLRRDSRGETSASILDCLSFGLPTILNAHGAAAEIPAADCLRLDDDFSDAALVTAIERLHADGALRIRLSEQASRYIHAHHAPAQAAQRFREAIETIELRSPVRAEQGMLAALGAASAGAAQPDLLQTAAAIAANRPGSGARQVLVDIGALKDASLPGVLPARAQLCALLAGSYPGWRIEPVHHDGVRYHYARRFTLDLIGRSDLQIEDAVVDAKSGDVVLALHAATGPVTGTVLPPTWRARGVTTCVLELRGADTGTDDATAQLAAVLAQIGR